MARYFLIAIALILWIFVAQTPAFTPTAETIVARLGGERLLLEVANTPQLRERGLSGRKALERGHGILFIFPEDDLHGFWMKGMHFLIDIIRLDAMYRIVEAHERVQPDSYPKVFLGTMPARYVLELPAGFFVEHQLAPGARLEILP
jgi:uncharacterized membrane protein (UPF0127 family)